MIKNIIAAFCFLSFYNSAMQIPAVAAIQQFSLKGVCQEKKLRYICYSALNPEMGLITTVKWLTGPSKGEIYGFTTKRIGDEKSLDEKAASSLYLIMEFTYFKENRGKK
jgi:hypothetical protein